jgi:hypothetical protein
MRYLTFGLAITALYVAFCGKTLGYYVSPEEWLTGSYRTPVGHACLARTDTCRRWFPDASYDTGGDTYSYDDDYSSDGVYYDDKPANTRDRI